MLISFGALNFTDINQFPFQSIAHHHWKKQQIHIEPQCTASGVAKKPGKTLS